MISKTRERLLIAEAESLKAYCGEQVEGCTHCIFYDEGNCRLRIDDPENWTIDEVKERTNAK